MAIEIVYPQSITNPYSIPLSRSQSKHLCCRSHLLTLQSTNPRTALSFSLISPRTTNSWGSFLIRTRSPSRSRIRSSREQDAESEAAEEGESPSQSTPVPSSPSPPTPAPSSSSGSPRRDKKWWRSAKRQWQPFIRAQEVGVLLLQLGILMFSMRMLRPGSPFPGSETRPATTYVSVPFSEFLSKIYNDEVKKVEVDGVHIVFGLRSDPMVNVEGDEAEVLTGSVPTPKRRIVYKTTRPGDIKTPYEKMLENEVEFGSPDKRSISFVNSALIFTRGR